MVVVQDQAGEGEPIDPFARLGGVGPQVAPQPALHLLGVGARDELRDAPVEGHVGPKAFATLQAGGAIVFTGASGTVADAVEQIKAGKLQQSNGADVQGHWV